METKEERDRPELKHGHKYDGGKLRYDLLSPSAIEGLVKVLTHGAEKYEDWNWAKGMNYSRVFAAAQRHLWEWQAGRDIDDDSKLNHLYHAMCCLMFLAHYQEWNAKFGSELDPFDDRHNSDLIRLNADWERKYGDLPKIDVWPVQ